VIESADLTMLRDMIRETVRAEVAPLSAALDQAVPAVLKRVECLEIAQKEQDKEIVTLKEKERFATGRGVGSWNVVVMLVSLLAALANAISWLHGGSK